MIALTNKAHSDLQILTRLALEGDKNLVFSGVIESLELLERYPGLGVSGSLPDTRELQLNGGFLAVYTMIDDSILVFRIIPEVPLGLVE